MTSAALIEVCNVRKSFNGFVAVEDLSFGVDEGEIIALLGRTGAGKSTVLNLVMGTIRPIPARSASPDTTPTASSARFVAALP